jgi:sulfite exporter TauE/SafE
MLNELQVLIITAISIAALHTLAGPDHYLPFIALSRARGWSASKTIGWTLICGSGHVLSSVLLGLGGAALGWSLSTLTVFEGVRGGIAAWSMLCFGLVYGCWGLWFAAKNARHKHFDLEGEDGLFVYEHRHGSVIAPKERYKVTPWIMFVIFILGPCEPMIPLLYFPGAKNSLIGMAVLIMVYTIVTLLTMLVMVLFGYYGVRFINTGKLEKYVHALGGLTIFTCGFGMIFLDW